MSAYKWSCFQGEREDQQPGTDLQGPRASRGKQPWNGDIGTFWKRSAIQHREGKATLDASRHGKAQEGMDKLSLIPPLLCIMNE